jgi:hypothetical protein
MVDSVTGGNGHNVETSFFGAQSQTNAITVTDTFFATGGGGCVINCPYFYVDALDPSFQFGAVLAQVAGPMTATLTLTGVVGDYTMVYQTPASGGGTTRVGGGGVTIPNYSSTVPGGALTFTKSNGRFPSQTFTLEYGAVIIDQPQGSVMAVPPTLRALSTSTTAALAWTYPGLTGVASNAGGGRATVSMTPAAVHSLSSVSHSLSFTLATTHPALWSSYWTSQMALAGIQNDPLLKGLTCLIASWPPGYVITTTSTSATLTVVGSCSILNDVSSTVQLSTQEADVTVNVSSQS